MTPMSMTMLPPPPVIDAPPGDPPRQDVATGRTTGLPVLPVLPEPGPRAPGSYRRRQYVGRTRSPGALTWRRFASRSASVTRCGRTATGQVLSATSWRTTGFTAASAVV